jgi:A/G-specific adenine glycosylase
MKNASHNLNNNWFSSRLLNWHRTVNKRQMPWKGETQPYRIWLSEIILQQTRVEQGLEYYEKFVNQYPDVHSLANAEEKEVFKLWEGLGYYNRCSNLLSTARFIAEKKNGVFPSNYEEIINLKGIGPYTAAAISSFAFGLPYAVVDGNVYRVLSRLFDIDIPVDSVAGKKYFASLADKLLDRNSSGEYNQAIMDFGATVCKPVPVCSTCIFNDQCAAFLSGKQDTLPVKEKKVKIRKRWFGYFLFEFKDHIAIRKRVGNDIWQQLFEFPQLETGEKNSEQLILLAEKQGLLKKHSYDIVGTSAVYRQQLSHQLVFGQFIKVRLNEKPENTNEWLWIKQSELVKFPFPRIINQYLQNSHPDLVYSG